MPSAYIRIEICTFHWKRSSFIIQLEQIFYISISQSQDLYLKIDPFLVLIYLQSFLRNKSKQALCISIFTVYFLGFQRKTINHPKTQFHYKIFRNAIAYRRISILTIRYSTFINQGLSFKRKLSQSLCPLKTNELPQLQNFGLHCSFI